MLRAGLLEGTVVATAAVTAEQVAAACAGLGARTVALGADLLDEDAVTAAAGALGPVGTLVCDAAPAFVAMVLMHALWSRLGPFWVLADVTALPFGDGAFDAVTVGFGIRNVPDLETGLAELARVLRPGGRLACLEITRPDGALRPFFRLWFDGLVPLAGKVLPGGGAYSYLPASVRRFPGPEDLADAMRRAGFEEVGWRLLGGGIVALHMGRRS